MRAQTFSVAWRWIQLAKDHWPAQQRILYVELYLINRSIVVVEREFRRIYGDNRQRGVVPSRNIITHWVQQWRETGPVQNKSRVRQKTVLTPENVERVRKALMRNPRRSVTRLPEF